MSKITLEDNVIKTMMMEKCQQKVNRNPTLANNKTNDDPTIAKRLQQNKGRKMTTAKRGEAKQQQKSM